MGLTKPNGQKLPKEGTIYWYPVIAIGTEQQDENNQAEKKQADLQGLVDLIRSLLESAESKTVIYFHCINGHDRTGCLHACYSLKYQSATLSDIWQVNGKWCMGETFKSDYAALIQY